MMNSMESAARKARTVAQDSVSQLQAAGRTAVEGARDVAEDLRDTAQGTAARAERYGREKARDLYDTAQQKVDRSILDLDRYVRANPLTSLAIALGIGIVLGAVSRR